MSPTKATTKPANARASVYRLLFDVASLVLLVAILWAGRNIGRELQRMRVAFERASIAASPATAGGELEVGEVPIPVAEPDETGAGHDGGPLQLVDSTANKPVLMIPARRDLRLVDTESFRLIEQPREYAMKFHQDFNGHVTLIVFWAQWCEPCKEELKWLPSALQTFGETHSDFRVEYMADGSGVADDTTTAKLARSFGIQSHHSVTWRSQYRFGQREGDTSLPWMVLVGPDAVVLAEGPGPTSEQGRGELEAILDELYRRPDVQSRIQEAKRRAAAPPPTTVSAPPECMPVAVRMDQSPDLSQEQAEAAYQECVSSYGSK